MRSLVSIVFGCIPSLVFFYWVGKGCQMPIVESWLGKSDVGFWRFTAGWFNVAFDLYIIGWFGFLHTGLAGINRTAYLVVTGLSCLALMGLWQHLDGTVWDFGFSIIAQWCIFGTMLGAHFSLVIQHGLRPFLGWDHTIPKLQTNGIYGIVRHPMHLAIMSVIGVTPLMTYDRLTLFVGLIVYLTVAVPIEEKRLIEQFGQEYLDYSRRVSAIIPMWPRGVNNG